MSRASRDQSVAQRARWRRWVLLTVAIAQALLVLGPAVGPGVVIAYDMPWSPDPRWTPFVLGQDTPAPRAVPSDAVAVLIGKVIGAGVAQAVVLLAILVFLGLGASALLVTLRPSAPLVARVAAMTAAVWNPFVEERLVVGQWTVLLGLAVLPWAIRAGLRVIRGHPALPSLLVCIAAAGLGGANSLVMVLAAVVPLVLVGATRAAQVRTGLAALLVTGLGSAAVWALPALYSRASSGSIGATAFRPSADTPLGVIGSIVSGGGFWNAAAHPGSRQVLVVAVCATALAVLAIGTLFAHVGGMQRTALVAGVGLPTALVLVSAVSGLEAPWVALVTQVPGGGILRDSHKLMAPWVIAVAVGVGMLVSVILERRSALAGPATAVLVLAPVALNPLLAWGAHGRLVAVDVPGEYRSAVQQLNALPPGDVGALPWSQYRRYDWNGSRVSLTLLPRMVSHTVVFDDRLPLRAGVVPGESDRAAGVSAAIEGGQSPGAALAQHGRVRYLASEGAPPGGEAEDITTLGRVVVDLPGLQVIEVGVPSPPVSDASPLLRLGWLITLGTTALVGVITLAPRVRGAR